MIEIIKPAFKKIYGQDPVAVYFAPGRVNLIGEHLDYNGGHVLPYALKMGIYLAIGNNDTNSVNFQSASFEDTFEQLLSKPIEKKGKYWYNYPLGVCKYMLEERKITKGFNFYYMADLPIASGLSSSAAIEVVTAFALADVLNLKLTKEEIALLCLKVENEFVGMGCGVMDQMASAICKQHHCLLLNCTDLTFIHIPLLLGDNEIIISHTGKSRSLDGSAFNERREECSRAMAELQKYYSINELCELKSDSAVFNLIKDENARKRAKHVIKENERVLKAAKALKKNKINKLGRLMNKSHDSLRDYYEVTGFELDTIVAEARKIEGVLAARMSGGGFGGCSINLVRKDRIEAFKTELAKNYKEKTGLDVSFYSGESGGGARKIE